MALRTKVIMEDYTTIEENVFQYLQTKNDCVDPKAKYTLSITKISVMTNFNYLVTIQNKITQQTEEQVLYRKFGEISECVDRNLETTIIDQLSSDGIAPKILYNDKNGLFRIDEYISETTHIKQDSQFKSDIIEQIIQICVSYSLISSIYTFTVQVDELFDNFSITINCNNDLKRKKIAFKDDFLTLAGVSLQYTD